MKKWLIVLVLLVLVSPASATVIEIINVGINQSYINAHPELLTGPLVSEMLADLNLVFAPSGKQYQLNQVFAYPDSAFGDGTDEITWNPVYYYDNNWGTWRGTTIWLYYSPSGYPSLYPVCMTTACSVERTAGGENFVGVYYGLWTTDDNLLINRYSGSHFVNGFLSKDAALRILAHEMGHSNALGSPEQYCLNWNDYSNQLPNMGYVDYRWVGENYKDPMGAGDILYFNILENKFNTFDKWLIGNNAYHNYVGVNTPRQLIQGMPLRVQVVYPPRTPVPYADVYVYPGVDGWCQKYNMTTYAGPYETDANGYAYIPNDFYGPMSGKSVKAYLGPYYAGTANIFATDIMDSKLRLNKSVHTVVVPLYQQ
jgi:hypothetical protein